MCHTKTACMLKDSNGRRRRVAFGVNTFELNARARTAEEEWRISESTPKQISVSLYT